MYNHQLYQEFRQSRHTKATRSTHKHKNMLHALVELPNSQIVTLENSIPILRSLGLVEDIKNVEQIVDLMQNRKNERSGWEGDERQIWECRLIYFLWHIIGHQQIEMREFKELIMLLCNQQKDRIESLEEMFGEKEQIGELVQTWDRLFIDNRSSPQLNDISIIKTKNQGSFGSNKQNLQAQNNSHIPTIRNSFDPKSSRHSKSRLRLEKSYTKKSAKTTVDRSSSVGRMSSKRSEVYSMNNYNTPAQEVNFFTQGQTLTIDDEKRLVNRLYDYSKYRTREQMKQQLEEQRVKIEIDSCTFKPQINRTIKCHKEPAKEIKGFNRAIDRMKQGYQKKTQLKQNLQYRIIKQLKPAPNRLTQGVAPKFHMRPAKQQKTELFQVKFSLGRMSIPIKIRQSDSLDELVESVGRIYSLKPHQKNFIRESIISSLQQYKQVVLQGMQIPDS